MHMMYVDKPMRGHGLMQAIARVNRVFRGKLAGLIVDYIGIVQNLKDAIGHLGALAPANCPKTFRCGDCRHQTSLRFAAASLPRSFTTSKLTRCPSFSPLNPAACTAVM